MSEVDLYEQPLPDGSVVYRNKASTRMAIEGLGSFACYLGRVVRRSGELSRFEGAHQGLACRYVALRWVSGDPNAEPVPVEVVTPRRTEPAEGARVVCKDKACQMCRPFRKGDE